MEVGETLCSSNLTIWIRKLDSKTNIIRETQGVSNVDISQDTKNQVDKVLNEKVQEIFNKNLEAVRHTYGNNKYDFIEVEGEHREIKILETGWMWRLQMHYSHG